jgi:hypothetical protein
MRRTDTHRSRVAHRPIRFPLERRHRSDVLFETHRLVVRRAGPADADALLGLFGDAETVRYYGWVV